jgi:hypothetical protein
VSAGPARLESGVVWLFLLDDLHVEFRTTGIVRAWLSSLLKDLIREGDVFTARSTGPSSLSVGLLASLAELEDAVRRFSGSALKPQDVQQPQGAEEIRHRARITMRTAAELLSAAPRHDPRRRVMVYIGKGFDPGPVRDEATDKFLAEAGRLEVTVIALDASALPGAQPPVPYLADAERMRELQARRSSLERLALPTHGFVLADEDSVRDAAVRIGNSVR